MMKGYLTPYKGISYHFQEFRRRGRSPRTRHENFNHAHLSLRCVIECTFGVWRNKWRIIRNMPSFPFHIQILIVSTTVALHNFVRLNDRDDRGFINANRDSISRREHNREAGSSYGVFQPRKTWDAPVTFGQRTPCDQCPSETWTRSIKSENAFISNKRAGKQETTRWLFVFAKTMSRTQDLLHFYVVQFKLGLLVCILSSFYIFILCFMMMKII